MLTEISDMHCFEVSGVIDAVKEILTSGLPSDETASDAIRDRVADIASRTSFLPAPKTWIEWGDPGARVGCLLQEMENFAVVRLVTSEAKRGVFCSLNYAFSIGLGARGGKADEYLSSRDLTHDEQIDVGDMSATLNGVLAFINSPHVIGRQLHAPHRGLEKKLRARPSADGPLKLHPWTEIKLHVTPPKDMAGDGPHDAHLTGQRALHFCRSHLRIQNGKLVVVRAHWRGDASLGIKRSRYKVTA